MVVYQQRRLEKTSKCLTQRPILRVHSPLEDALELAVQHNLTSYNATYLALAVAESVPIATLHCSLPRTAESADVEQLM